jgi:hypothetical protein
MSVIVWYWSKEPEAHFKLHSTSLRRALTLATEDVRAAAAWRFSSLFLSDKQGDDQDDDQEARERWPRVGPAFFQEVWPLEQLLQSPSTANDFARIPARAGPKYFVQALDTVLPYLQPFEVWSIQTEFGLHESEASEEIVRAHPEHVLALLAVCISDTQRHYVYDLNKLLDRLVQVYPDLQRDSRMRRLRRLSVAAS